MEAPFCRVRSCRKLITWLNGGGKDKKDAGKSPSHVVDSRCVLNIKIAENAVFVQRILCSNIKSAKFGPLKGAIDKNLC
jgi:hypothetical protein